jgi:hypothetical protein
MAHRALDGDQIDAAGDEQRAVRMPEVVEAQRWQPGSVAGAIVATPQS